MPDRPVTIRDVAAAARVHPATASRAMNPETRVLVSDKTARRVLRVAKSLGYRPNPMARTLRTRRSHTVGVLIPDLTNPLFPPIIRGLEDRLADVGYVALIGNTDGDSRRERLVFDQMRARHVDGFVLATARLADPLLAEAERDELPVVLVNRVTRGAAGRVDRPEPFAWVHGWPGKRRIDAQPRPDHVCAVVLNPGGRAVHP